MIRFAVTATLLCATLAAGQAPAPAGPTAALSPAEARAQVLQLADARRFDSAAIEELAGSSAASVRVAVARLLGELANGQAWTLLANLAKDPEPAVRGAAVESIGRLCATLGAGGVCARLGAVTAARLADPDAGVRRAAGWAVGAAFPEHGVDLVERLPREADSAVRAAWLAELWRGEGEAWVASAIGALSSASPEERLAAAWSLGRGRRREGLAEIRRRVTDADPLVRAALLEAGRRVDAAAMGDLFAAALVDDDRRVRSAALTGLATAAKPLSEGTEDAVAAIIGDATFPRVQERVAAIRAAGATGCCTESLAAAVASGEPWVAGEALEALARQGAAGVAQTVEEWLAADDVARRVAAVRAAAHLSSPAETLTAAFGDGEPAVRLAAVAASEALPADARARLLRGRFHDPDPAVRAAAIDALAAIDRLPPAGILAAMVRNELRKGAPIPDAAVALVGALAAGDPLPAAAEQELRELLTAPDPVVARAAWRALHDIGATTSLPEVAAEGLDLYRQVIAWAAERRWLRIVTWRGTMVVELDTGTAPLTAYRLSELAEDHFFDGLTFHRVVPNFVVQGGDPRGDGWGGPGFALRDELSLATYGAGDVGMALAGSDTGGSQLFVTLTPQPHLVGRYPHVGRVVAGFDVAERLRVGDRILRVRTGSGEPPTTYPILYGPLAYERLEQALPELRGEREAYQPRAELVELLAAAKLRYEITVAMGSWCSDSRREVPRLMKILERLGDRSPFEPPHLLGIDRSKRTGAGEWGYGEVELVPTIVVSVGGAELGRIVESPSSGSLEEDLVTILAPVEGFTPPPAPQQGADGG